MQLSAGPACLHRAAAASGLPLQDPDSAVAEALVATEATTATVPLPGPADPAPAENSNSQPLTGRERETAQLTLNGWGLSGWFEGEAGFGDEAVE